MPHSSGDPAIGGDVAVAKVDGVRDDPSARLALMRTSYRVPSSVDRGYLPYREARPPS
ncbi:hypothetical protein I553_3897 [Mycobacterium xenopi 4042]|uniref:Uncharacterized protein n=1 Tax=Mycobacterium xenopi 4042 TaxID=1299334 RepID=X8DEG3_MYCXE|nr:hypothetical protein I553_3897 [Mycobacterium xenopi 4042]